MADHRTLEAADIKPRPEVEHHIPYARQLVANLAAKRGGAATPADVGDMADFYEDLATALRYVAEEQPTPGPGPKPASGGSSCV